jgi:hypothetical protein
VIASQNNLKICGQDFHFEKSESVVTTYSAKYLYVYKEDEVGDTDEYTSIDDAVLDR